MKTANELYSEAYRIISASYDWMSDEYPNVQTVLDMESWLKEYREHDRDGKWFGTITFTVADAEPSEISEADFDEGYY